MLQITDLRGQSLSVIQLRSVLPRGATDVGAVSQVVEPVVHAVRDRGVDAALDYGETFDGIRPAHIKVPAEVMQAAVGGLTDEVADALREAMRRIRAVHASQKPLERTLTVAPGAVVTERFIPVERVGLYVPGGKAVYPSSVLMNVIPAQEAGVDSLVVASPPQVDNNSWPHPTILAACSLLGVDEVWAVGGAQAVALMAYGDDVQDLRPVDMITGPGNIYVTAAKRAVRGLVGIDAEAGPTEIAIVADDSADPVHVAYDLISQAEHDIMAASLLITDSERLAHTVDEEVEARFSVTFNSDRVEAALRGQQSGIVLVNDIAEALRVADAYAAEHLEIHTRNAADDARAIRNAGAIFVGTYSPVPLGDYAAGSNHVLPTSGSARHSAGLSTHTFLKPVNLIEYNQDALRDISQAVIALADEERLPAHGESIKARFDEKFVENGVATGVHHNGDAPNAANRTAATPGASASAASTVDPSEED